LKIAQQRGSLLVLLAAGVGLSTWMPAASDPQSHDQPQQQGSEHTRRRAVTALLRDDKGDTIGSGVIVGTAPGGSWLATNRHVVDGHGTVCVVTIDGQVRAALKAEPEVGNTNQSLDLALLWVPTGAKAALVAAMMQTAEVKPSELPVVVATGFPSHQQTAGGGQGVYSEVRGLLVPLLKEPLEGGFDLAYTAAVEKGMSGGGVFIGDRLIGINGSHPHPLWPGRWNHQNGRPVSDQLNQQVDLVALGLSVAAIEKRLGKATRPVDQVKAQLDSARCASSSVNAVPRPIPAW
jgi:hypothetical protein